MSLKTMTLLSGASLAATGGTAITLSDDGVSVQGGLHLIVNEDTDAMARRTVTVKNRPASYDPRTKTWSKVKQSMVFAKPMTLADGSVVFNTIRLEREVHPSVQQADAFAFNVIGAQLLFDADVCPFWHTGSLS